MFNSSSRWYDTQAQVFIGLTDDEALGMGLYPSVTTVLRVIRRPALERWYYTRVAQAAQMIHRSDFSTEDEWFRAVEREADAEAFKARARGLAAHRGVGALAELAYPPGSFTITEPPPPMVSQKWRFGGQADALIEFPGEPPLLVELKTTSRTPPVIWGEHLLQMGAYSHLYNLDRGVFLILSKDGNVLTQEIDSSFISEARETFLLLSKIWWRMKEIHKPIQLTAHG